MVVYDNVVGRVTIDFLKSAVLDLIADWPNPKNNLPKRKLGNRLFMGIGKNIGEAGLDKVHVVINTLQELCQDMNFTIRKDAALWLKDYLIKNIETLKGTPRFEDVYLPEIQELLNDESGEVRIEAIEGCLCVLELIDKRSIEEEFIPSMNRAFNFDKNSEESMQRMARMIGQIAFKLSKLGLLLKYK